ncbi:MAG: phage head closure protein [Lachnospiraceae bacterium]|nr:phage head closure protein [Lachnospiraceae bacterium]
MIKKNQTENLEKKVFGEIQPVGRDEFAAAGQKNHKASLMVEVWGFEYENQTEIVVDGKKYAIYRTYGPKNNGKIELYAGERVGKG